MTEKIPFFLNCIRNRSEDRTESTPNKRSCTPQQTGRLDISTVMDLSTGTFESERGGLSDVHFGQSGHVIRSITVSFSFS